MVGIEARKDGNVIGPGGYVARTFSWLLTLHPAAAGRTYAAYGGIYIAAALLWLRIVDGVAPTRWDVPGACVALLGMAIIVIEPNTQGWLLG